MGQRQGARRQFILGEVELIVIRILRRGRDSRAGVLLGARRGRSRSGLAAGVVIVSPLLKIVQVVVANLLTVHEYGGSWRAWAVSGV